MEQESWSETSIRVLPENLPEFFHVVIEKSGSQGPLIRVRIRNFAFIPPCNNDKIG